MIQKNKKYYLIAGAALSIPACFYSFLCVAYYAWLNAAEPERWPPERAMLFSGSFLILAVLFIIILFIVL
jgi:hypothetical protein